MSSYLDTDPAWSEQGQDVSHGSKRQCRDCGRWVYILEDFRCMICNWGELDPEPRNSTVVYFSQALRCEVRMGAMPRSVAETWARLMAGTVEAATASEPKPEKRYEWDGLDPIRAREVE